MPCTREGPPAAAVHRLTRVVIGLIAVSSGVAGFCTPRGSFEAAQGTILHPVTPHSTHLRIPTTGTGTTPSSSPASVTSHPHCTPTPLTVLFNHHGARSWGFPDRTPTHFDGGSDAHVRAEARPNTRSCSTMSSATDEAERDSPKEDFRKEFYRIQGEIRQHNRSDLYKQYSNLVPLTVNILRQEYGERASWWGDLTTKQTRKLYQRLLPRVILSEDEFKSLPLKDRAYIASMARYAAKLYTRERSTIPGRLLANLYDGARYALATGKLSWTGMSVVEIWRKYEDEVKAELTGDVDDITLYDRLYERILARSCATNPLIDQIAVSDILWGMRLPSLVVVARRT